MEKAKRNEIFSEWRTRWLTNFCMADKHHYAVRRQDIDRLISIAYQEGLDEIKFNCPVWQCGGKMKPKERAFPKGKTEDDFPDGYAGDSQVPDLVCSSCKAVYRIIRLGQQKIDGE